MIYSYFNDTGPTDSASFSFINTDDFPLPAPYPSKPIIIPTMKTTATLFLLLSLSLSCFAQLNRTTISIPMRDGKNLAADLYLPNNTDSFPTILIQTPYSKGTFPLSWVVGRCSVGRFGCGRRKNQVILSHGYTRLRLGDVVTLVGSLESLENTRLRVEI